MKKNISWFILLLTLLLLISSGPAHSSSLWDEFLRHPNESQFAKLENRLKTAREPCGPGTAPLREQQELLFNLVHQANSRAFRAVLDVRRCLGAAPTEDFCVSAAAFFERKPVIFLRIVKEKAIKDPWLECFLTALPLDLVDVDVDKVIVLVDNRIAILNSTDDPSVIEIKKRGLYFLHREKESLHKIKREKTGQVRH